LENCVEKAVDRLWVKCRLIPEGVLPGWPSGDKAGKLSIETKPSQIGVGHVEARIFQLYQSDFLLESLLLVLPHFFHAIHTPTSPSN
jgi:hypothetical protein